MYYNKNQDAQVQLTHEAFDAIPDKQRVLEWCWYQYNRDVKITQRYIDQHGMEGKDADRLWNAVNTRFRQDLQEWFWRHFHNYKRQALEQNPEKYRTEWIHASEI